MSKTSFNPKTGTRMLSSSEGDKEFCMPDLVNTLSKIFAEIALAVWRAQDSDYGIPRQLGLSYLPRRA